MRVKLNGIMSKAITAGWILTLIAVLQQAQCRSLPLRHEENVADVTEENELNETGLWQPEGNRTRDQWIKCHGAPADRCEHWQTQMTDLKNAIYQRISKRTSPSFAKGQRKTSSKNVLSNINQKHAETASQLTEPATPVVSATNSKTSDNNTLEGCILLTEEQIADIMNRLNDDDSKPLKNRRRKRALADFQKYPYSKWSMPVHYKFDRSQNIYQMGTIRRAMQHWMDNTCVRFQEIPTEATFSSNHLLITSSNTGCYSYVGKVNLIPQQLNLQDVCLSRFGTPVHELGHALGLWHEQMRSDRDNYIDILWADISPAYLTQYAKASTVDGGVPYNYGSVMHYAPKDASSLSGSNTMRTINPLYQQNMGQRTGLSFDNIKLINRAYCSNVCDPSALAGRTCQRGGYQHPNNCSRCLCPDGFSGTYCENVASSEYATCGGLVDLSNGVQRIITSPGYDTDRFYLSYQSCTWLFKAPANYAVQIKFVGDFGVYCEFGACYHWVEVKYKSDLGLEGPRFCCSNRPNVTITSETNEMMVIFKSNFSHDILAAQRGFQAVVSIVPVTTSTTSSSTSSSSTVSSFPSTTSRTTTVSKLTNASSIHGASTTTTRPVSTVTTTATRPTANTSTTTQPLPNNKMDQNPADVCGQIDLALLIDASTGVGSVDNWTSLTSFLTRTLSRLTSPQYGWSASIARLALIPYADSATVLTPAAGGNVSDSWVSQTLRTTSRSPSSTRNVSGALRVAQSLFQSTVTPDRKQVVILVTTGGGTVDVDQTASTAAALRQNGVRLVVVGVGSRVNGTEASAIAGSDSSVVFVSSWAADQVLSIVSNRLNDIVCKMSSATSNRQILSTCSFEQPENNLCGYIQDTTDQFDWTVYSGPTPSDPTGPDQAYSGNYYIFIEASAPRQLNDHARLLLPAFNYDGEVCVDFYYHMFGFHVNTLQLIQRLPAVDDVIVWMRSYQMDNSWHHASVQVPMTSASQLIFDATRGNEYSGDIGLDLITVTTGQCPT